MAIEKLTLVNAEGPLRKVNKTLIRCCESGYFHICPPPDTSELHLEAKSLRDKGQYERMIKRCTMLAEQLGIKLDEKAGYDNIEYNLSVDFKGYLDEIDKKTAELLEEKTELKESIKSHGAIYNNLCQLTDFNANFEELFECEYVKMRFGRIPSSNIRKLEYYSERPFLFFEFKGEKNYTWCLYITSKTQSKETDYLFNSLGFQRVVLPDYLNGSSNEASERLLETIRIETEKVESIERKLAEVAKQESEKLSQVYAKLIALDNSYVLRSNVLIVDSRFHFSGYIPARKEKDFKALMAEIGDVEVTPVSAKDTEAPVKLRNNRLFRPFEMFVKMYGLPSADGIDPTPIVAITYMLVYGIMFGDLGQGLCITLLGLLLTKFTNVKLAPIMTRIGISSALFGILYGSVFGNEHIITPFFHVPEIYTLLGYNSPPENIFQVSTVLLIAALLIGIILVILSMILNMIICFKAGDKENGLFGASGLVGFVFYVALILGVGGSFIGLNLMNPVYIAVFIVLPLVIMFFKEPILELLHSEKSQSVGKGNVNTGFKAKLDKMMEEKGKKSEKKSIGNFIIEGVIELFETCLTYLTNTMSFLRIGGFILSHAGLMLVVNVLADLTGGGVGYIIVQIIGNAFVTGVEGFLVGIQVLRLEFYELFSRFFKGGGKPFNPVTIGNNTEA